MAVLLNLPPPQRLPGGLGRLGQIPLVIITPPAGRLEQLSSASRHLVSRQGGHMIPRDDPEIVIEAVRGLSARD